MSAAHTPGPWSNSNYDIYGPNKDDGSRCVIASLCFSKKAPDTGQGGNARLIAAAPDLLAALQLFNNDALIECAAGGVYTISVNGRDLIQMRDAIDKATGRAS